MSFAIRKSFLFLFFAALLSLAVPQAFAQATGNIRGTVVDPSGAVIPGAEVSAVNTATTVSRSVTTNQDGIYVFPDLAIGTYSLSISRDGFKTEKRSGIQLLTAQTIDLRIQLPIGSATQSVEVSVDGPLIQTTSSAVQTSVEQTEVREAAAQWAQPAAVDHAHSGRRRDQRGHRGHAAGQHRHQRQRPAHHAKHVPAGWRGLQRPLLRFSAHPAQSGRAAGVHHPVLELQRGVRRRGRPGTTLHALRN